MACSRRMSRNSLMENSAPRQRVPVGWTVEDPGKALTLPIAKARGFSARRHEPPSEVLQWLPERSLLRGGSGVPRPTYPHPGHLTTCQVVQVPGLVLATLGSRSWLMFYVRTFSPQPPTSSCQRA